jgi:hypothetical protein
MIKILTKNAKMSDTPQYYTYNIATNINNEKFTISGVLSRDGVFRKN